MQVRRATCGDLQVLVVNEIGTGWALLYEEYAAVLERDDRYVEL
jgi:hypothetical protein